MYVMYVHIYIHIINRMYTICTLYTPSRYIDALRANKVNFILSQKRCAIQKTEITIFICGCGERDANKSYSPKKYRMIVMTMNTYTLQSSGFLFGGLISSHQQRKKKNKKKRFLFYRLASVRCVYFDVFKFSGERTNIDNRSFIHIITIGFLALIQKTLKKNLLFLMLQFRCIVVC